MSITSNLIMAFYDSETLFVFIVSFHLPLELLLINYLKKKKNAWLPPINFLGFQ